MFRVRKRVLNSSYMTFVAELIKSLGHEIPESPENRPFHTGDIIKMEKEFREVGFSKVKLYYTQSDILFDDETELFRIFASSPLLEGLMKKITEEQKKTLLDELHKKWNERFGPDSVEPMRWELLVCIVTK